MTVDYEARQQASLAHQKIDTHEDRCKERWEAARKEWNEVKKSVNGLYKRAWWFAGLIITTQTIAIVTLIRYLN